MEQQGRHHSASVEKIFVAVILRPEALPQGMSFLGDTRVNFSIGEVAFPELLPSDSYHVDGELDQLTDAGREKVRPVWNRAVDQARTRLPELATVFPDWEVRSIFLYRNVNNTMVRDVDRFDLKL
ncbi:MAG: hypothetical protein WCW66_00100 [Patescibacteria group bacterium]